MLEDCPPVLAAYEEFKRFSSDPVMREKVRARERFLNDERLKLAGAKREGRTEEKIENARNLKRLGVPIATIAEGIGLSPSEVERLD
jgi:hypothetical protein